MKKVLNTSCIYTVLGMLSGIGYREFSKFYPNSTQSVLADIHVHFFVLGMLFFLIIAVMLKVSPLKETKEFHRFFILYNIMLPFMIIMMIIRGVLQSMEITVQSSMDHMIAGIAGLSHIGMMAAFILFFIGVRKAFLQ